jgi:hypothetical protein
MLCRVLRALPQPLDCAAPSPTHALLRPPSRPARARKVDRPRRRAVFALAITYPVNRLHGTVCTRLHSKFARRLAGRGLPTRGSVPVREPSLTSRHFNPADLRCGIRANIRVCGLNRSNSSQATRCAARTTTSRCDEFQRH